MDALYVSNVICQESFENARPRDMSHVVMLGPMFDAQVDV